MPREFHTAEEIRAEVDRLEVPMPYRLAFDPGPFRTPPEANCQMPLFRQAAGNEQAIRRATVEVMRDGTSSRELRLQVL